MLLSDSNVATERGKMYELVRDDGLVNHHVVTETRANVTRLNIDEIKFTSKQFAFYI